MESIRKVSVEKVLSYIVTDPPDCLEIRVDFKDRLPDEIETSLNEAIRGLFMSDTIFTPVIESIVVSTEILAISNELNNELEINP